MDSIIDINSSRLKATEVILNSLEYTSYDTFEETTLQKLNVYFS